LEWVKGPHKVCFGAGGAWRSLPNTEAWVQAQAPVRAGSAAGGLISFVPFGAGTAVRSGFQVRVGSAHDSGSIDHSLGLASQLPAVRDGQFAGIGLRVAAVCGRLHVTVVAAEVDSLTPTLAIRPRCVPCYPRGPTRFWLDSHNRWDHWISHGPLVQCLNR
jgi:hypothetical protein